MIEMAEKFENGYVWSGVLVHVKIQQQMKVRSSGQSKGERGGTAFWHFLFSVCLVPPPVINNSHKN